MAIINIGDQIYTAKSVASIEKKYGPYTSLQAAWEAIGPDGEDVACIGLTVGIQATPTSSIEEYWLKDAASSVNDFKIKGASLDNYVPVTRKITDDIDLQNDVTTNELRTSLGLGNLAYANTAKGTDSFQKIDGITMSPLTIEGSITIPSTPTEYIIPDNQKINYTPSGVVKVDGAVQSSGNKALKGGSINVSLTDASSMSSASITQMQNYIPEGNVTGTVSVPSSAVVNTASSSETGHIITGTISKPNISITSTSDTIMEAKTIGTAYTITEGAVSKSNDNTSKFTKRGFKFVMDPNDDEQLNIIEVLSTDAEYSSYFSDAVISSGSINYTPQELNGELPTFGASDNFIKTVAAELDTEPEFTGEKIRINLTNSDTDIDANFTATNIAVIPTEIGYYKQVVDEDNTSFNGVETELTFEGNTNQNLIPNAITYNQAGASTSFSQTLTPTVEAYDKVTQNITVIVAPYSTVE